MTFDKIGLIEPLLRALRHEGYKEPTPIQSLAIPEILAGRDLLGLAQTGTGKTAAFALPILQKLAKGVGRTPKAPSALILTPTRELAAQIAQSIITYGRHLSLKCAVIYGGVGQARQARELARGVDILVATPGRLLDLMNQRLVHLGKVKILTLDEADRMLDMGFIHDINKIVAAIPSNRQSLFFSATMPHAVKGLAENLLNDPATVSINPTATTADRIEQKVMFVERDDKVALLTALLEDKAIGRALVFTRTKHRANRVSDKLNKLKVSAEAIHGNKSQGARQRALKNFISGKVRVLVATDIAARGIDVEGITHVINFELPNEPESYIHRIGRTARAGASGVAISFCDHEEKAYLGSIERLIQSEVPVDEEQPFHSDKVAAAPRIFPPRPQRRNERGRNNGSGGPGGKHGKKRNFSRRH